MSMLTLRQLFVRHKATLARLAPRVALPAVAVAALIGPTYTSGPIAARPALDAVSAPVPASSLVATLTANRTTLVRLASVSGGSGVLAGTGILAVGVVAHVAALALVTAAAPVAIGGAGAYLILRKHRDFAQRMLLALEQVLDRLEYGDTRRASFLDAVAPPRALSR